MASAMPITPTITASPPGPPITDMTTKKSVSPGSRCDTAQSCTPVSIWRSRGVSARTRSAMSMKPSPVQTPRTAPIRMMPATGT